MKSGRKRIRKRSAGAKQRAVAEELYHGVVIGHHHGYGFLNVDDDATDCYLSPKQMRGLLDGDRIIARLVNIDRRRDRREVAVVEVLKRANQRIVGRCFKDRGEVFVAANNRRIHQDILITEEGADLVETGQYVVAELIRQPDRHTPPLGKIVEILNNDRPLDMVVDVAIREHDLPHVWSDQVLREAACFAGGDVDHCGNREDLRRLPLVTIDGDQARDFDDAVYCERCDSGWRLLVAIADVSHYLSAGCAIDEEAELRGNSVYFPGRVVPMLPEILSDDLCSLKPQADRLCMVCELYIDECGAVRQSRFVEGIMRSAARMTYGDVTLIIKGDDGLVQKYRDIVPNINDLYSLFCLLNSRRKRQGVLDFASVEAGFEFDEGGKILAIRSDERNDAHRLIEEFMLRANIAAAEFLLANNIPAVYRVHEAPEGEKWRVLLALLQELGVTSAGYNGKPVTKDYARLMDNVKDREDRHLIELLLLRSMPQAMYSEKNSGHFGLAFPAYAHFTSPIRRYADLMVHRAIRHLLRTGRASGFSYSPQQISNISRHCSVTERRAEEAAREVAQRYKCEFMHDKVGNIYQGIITSVVSFGMFVELDDIYVEGLVHIKTLAGGYRFDMVRHRLYADKGRQFSPGDSVLVRVLKVNPDERKIDFALSD